MKVQLLGNEITITQSKNKTLEKMTGRVVDETKNTLVIDTGKNTKKVLKKDITFKVVSEGKEIKVDGQSLIGKPEERIKSKKVVKRW